MGDGAAFCTLPSVSGQEAGARNSEKRSSSVGSSCDLLQEADALAQHSQAAKGAASNEAIERPPLPKLAPPMRPIVPNATHKCDGGGGGGDIDSHDHDHEHKWWRRTRMHFALLGLAIATVNCYAQATFCIAIVEMVVPADHYTSRDLSSSLHSAAPAASAVAVVVPVARLVPPPPLPPFVHHLSVGGSLQNATTSAPKPQSQDSLAHQTKQDSNAADDQDESCPIEFKYRHYYDNWRFPERSSNVSLPVAPANHAIDMTNRFDWDASQQGLLLGAFAFGTAPLQVVGGRLAEIYGAKWVLLAGCIGTALTNLAIPWLAKLSFPLLLLNRVLMGVAQAGMEPGLMCFLAEWLTPIEAGFFISMLLFAICVGFFLGSLLSSFILALGYGWPLAYYVSGGLNLAVGLAWLYYVDSWPRASLRISRAELKHIQRAQARAQTETQHTKDLTIHKTRQEIDATVGLAAANGSANTSLSSLATKACSEVDAREFNVPPTSTRVVAIADDEPGLAAMAHKLPLSAQTRACNNEQHEARETITPRSKVELKVEQQPNCAPDSLKVQGAPWATILSTRSVWAFIICKISIRWCADVLSNELPTYLANVLHLSIEINGLLNSVSSALFAICSFLTGWLVNEISAKRRRRCEDETSAQALADKTRLRKIFQSSASFGSALAVFLMTRYDCSLLFSMSMLLALSCCLVMGTGGELQIPYDMTARYPGTLHGMACTLSVSGWLAPPLIGLILGDRPESRQRWRTVWYLTAAINFIGGLVFVLFADARPRDFDRKRSRIGEQRAGPAQGESGGGDLGRGVARAPSALPPPPPAPGAYSNAACSPGSTCNNSPIMAERGTGQRAPDRLWERRSSPLANIELALSTPAKKGRAESELESQQHAASWNRTATIGPIGKNAARTLLAGLWRRRTRATRLATSSPSRGNATAPAASPHITHPKQQQQKQQPHFLNDDQKSQPIVDALKTITHL